MKKALLLALAAITAAAALNATPVTLYRVDLAPGTNAYRFAADNALPVYHIGAAALLVGARADPRRYPAIANVSLVYSGDTRDLRWVGARRKGSASDPGLARLFADGGLFLVRSDEAGRAKDLDRGSFLVTEFPERPIPVDARAVVINPGLAYDPAIGALAQQVTVEHFRADVESLQAFDTRNTGADVNGPVAAWIRDKFLGFGIADVEIDSYIDPGFSSGILIRNVIATIPGTADTNAVYVVGGHYDTSVWPFNPADPWAPGADDNGSGTAAAIEMARVLAANPPASTVKFIAFDCEEWGLYGSKRSANAAAASGEDIGCMLNYDMIGAANNDSVFVSKVYPGSEDYAQLLGRSAAWYGRTGDTGLVTEYNSVYLNGSDSWRYYNAGYKVTYSEELNFSEHYHMVSDSTSYMNMRYATSIVRAGLGMVATLANYPQAVKGLTVRDLGDGARLQATWQAAAATGVAGYRVYWGRASGTYGDSMTVTAAGDTIDGLLADSLYHVAVAAVDAQGRTSPFLAEATGTPRALPLAPSPVTATPVAGGVQIDWGRNTELDLAGYALYRRIDGGPADSLAAQADTTFTDQPLSGAGKYYYSVRAYDADGNLSAPGAEAYGRPYTLDQGILLVDETKNWTTGSYPRDTTQDNLYHALLAGYAYTDHEFDSLVRQPVEADFAPYSTVVWHTDDRDYFLGWSDTTALRRYLGHGGRLWLTGWLPLADLRNAATYPAGFGAGSFIHDCLKISYATQSSVTADTFIAARGIGGHPDVLVDSAKVPLGTWKGTLRYLEALTPVSPAEATYVIDMKNDVSPFEATTKWSTRRSRCRSCGRTRRGRWRCGC
ncbi:MAG: M20/M25/M40 family metallo-hydrolase [Candidatus Edwardsbacteria bacterium]|nr:M20/M25/M40 family metallo-hydrolase [Candidatus Edwardsbacteria bacterium]